MTPGIGFALVAMICFGVSDLIYKRAADSGIPSRQFIMMQAWVYCPCVTLYAWLTGKLHLTYAAAWGVLAGLFAFVGFYNFARSLIDGAVSTNAPIFRLNFTITAALAILLLGEPLTAAKGAALMLAFAAVWLLLAEPGQGRSRSTPVSLLRVSIATAGLGVANYLLKVSLTQGAVPETLIAIQSWVFCSTATLFTLFQTRRVTATAQAWRYSAPSGVVLVIAFVLLIHGLAVGPASVLTPVAQMSFVFTAIVGAAIFRERLGARKSIGLVIAAGALVLFAIG